MNTNDFHLLDQCVAAARSDVDRSTIDQAAERLRARLPRTRSRRWVWPQVPRFAGAAAVVTLSVLLGSLLLPGGAGKAFAEVQAWFQTFRTMHMQTEIREGDNLLTSLDVWIAEDGATRVETSGIAHIIDASAGTMTTLLPGDRYFRKAIGTAGVGGLDGVPLDWLDELRGAQRQAELLYEQRQIAGEEAAGYRLTVNDVRVTIWAATRDNRPLLVETDLTGDLRMTSEFAFNQPVAEKLFEVPEGFQAVDRD